MGQLYVVANSMLAAIAKFNSARPESDYKIKSIEESILEVIL